MKVEVPYSWVELAVSGGTLVRLEMNSSRKVQACSRWLELMITWTSYRHTHTYTHTHIKITHKLHLEMYALVTYYRC